MFDKKIVVLIDVPGADYISNDIPSGILSISNIFKEYDYDVIIFDNLITNEKLNEFLKETTPDIVGFSGISTSFGKAKEFSQTIKKISPNTLLLVGGPLASTYEYLIEDNVADFIFHGEVEISLPKFLEFLDGNIKLSEIGGLTYPIKDKNDINIPEDKTKIQEITDIFCRLKNEVLLPDLDIIPFPDYSVSNINRYVENLEDIESYFKGKLEDKYYKLIKSGKTRYVTVPTSRGCTHRCTFCYRQVNGIRRFSVDYVINHIRHLKKYVEIDGINFVDELFNNDLEWVYELCDALEEHKEELGLHFFRIAGMRADKIDDKLLKRLSEIGVITIAYGHESGSDEVLKYYKKGITVEQNIRANYLTEKNHIVPLTQLVIGSPVETLSTIMESVEFIKKVNAYVVSVNFMIALPETPLWKYAIENNKIPNVRQYFEEVFKYGGSEKLSVNFTNTNQLIKQLLWSRLIFRQQNLNYLKKYSLSWWFNKIYFRIFIGICAQLSKKLILNK